MIKDGLIGRNNILKRIYKKSKLYDKYWNCRNFKYLDGKLNKEGLENKTILNTTKLAKRQNTF